MQEQVLSLKIIITNCRWIVFSHRLLKLTYNDILSFLVSEAHKKHLTKEELKEKALEWFQPAHANFVNEELESTTEGGSASEDDDDGGAGAIAASVVMAMIPLVAMLLK